MKRLDPRVVRTRNYLREAMLKLLQEKSYTTITVNDITEAAGLNRATFYLHYEGKETLLIDSLETHFDELVAEIDEKLGDKTFTEDSYPLYATFKHVADNEALYRVLMSETGPGFVMQRMIDYIAMFGYNRSPAVQDENSPFSMEISLVSQHAAGSVFALLRWWLQHDMPYSPQEMADISQSLTMNGVLPHIEKVEAARIAMQETSPNKRN